MNSLSICWESKNDSSSKKAIGICGDWVKGGEAHNFQYTMTPRVMNSVIVAYGTDYCAITLRSTINRLQVRLGLTTSK